MRISDHAGNDINTDDLDEEKVERLEKYKENLEKIEKAAKNYDLKNEILSLFLKNDEHFYAVFSRKLVKKKDYSCPTAGVHYDPKRRQFVLAYNPRFM
ncbi:MAG: hypothetical protein ABEJ72_02000, partial [Candidatus Aenigmatarchaeota archaeon]